MWSTNIHYNLTYGTNNSFTKTRTIFPLNPSLQVLWNSYTSYTKHYIWVYRNNLGYFIRVGYLLDLGYCDHQNFEKKLEGIYGTIWWDVSQNEECYQPHISISTDSNVIDIHVTVSISQASEEDWKFLLEIPCYF